MATEVSISSAIMRLPASRASAEQGRREAVLPDEPGKGDHAVAVTFTGQLAAPHRYAARHDVDASQRRTGKPASKGDWNADHSRVPGGGSGNGWAEQQALDDLRRIKVYIPAKYWSVYEAVCRFDEPAGRAGSALTTYRNHQPTTARIIVQFVADVIALRENLTGKCE